MYVSLRISIPPSANNLFFNMPRKGRVKTTAYKAWLDAAAWEIRSQRPPLFTGDVRLDITIKRPNAQSDLDNRLKSALDALQKAGVIKNDRCVVDLRVRWGAVEGCQIVIGDVQQVAA